MRHSNWIVRTGATLLTLAMFGCAHGPTLSPEGLSASEAQIRAAEVAGADMLPRAAVHLKLAKEQLGRAKALSAKGDAHAPLVLARAQADGDLALALAKEKTAQVEASRALDRLREVDRE